MNKYLATLLLLSFFSLSRTHAQESYRVNYKVTYNGKPVPSQSPVVIGNRQETLITSNAILTNTGSIPYQESVIDASNSYLYTQATLKPGALIAMLDSTALKNQTFELTNETKQIAGYTCRKAKTTVNSNRIELWFTNELPLKGSPSVLGSKLGLVLEFSRNGDYVITAEKVEKTTNSPHLVLSQVKALPLMNALTYNELLWKSRYTTVPVLEKARLNFSGETPTSDSLLAFRQGLAQVKRIKFPKFKPGSRIFLDVTQKSLGDAYDRTGTVFLIPASKIKTENGKLVYIGEKGKEKDFAIASPGYEPNVELMRFFTSFGAGLAQANGFQIKGKEWAQENFFRQEVTDIASLLSGEEIYLGVQIENYDAKGHLVSANLTIHQEETASTFEKVIPLFNSLDVFEAKGDELRNLFKGKEGLKMTFTLDKPLKNARIRFLTTGHGGWENGDEYLRKPNTLYLNGVKVFEVIPWREDCGSYRMQNPISGNFANGLSSSDYSRSNWCPGTITNPYYIELGDLKAGTHTLQLIIPQNPDEGPSYSQWNVSGVLIGKE
ncbi:MAG: peptide-N-glycosidase [Bacteroidetes bacterium]|nr:peptide-N-glycosidase [Bacteroidota bacterium]